MNKPINTRFHLATQTFCQLCVCLLVVFASSCSVVNNTLESITPESDDLPPPEYQPKSAPSKSLDTFLQEAQQNIARFEEDHQFSLQALHAAVIEQRWAEANYLASLIKPETFNAADLALYSHLAVTSWRQYQQLEKAALWLSSPLLQAQLPFMSPNDQITLGMDRAAVFDEMGDPIASVRERVALEPLLDKAQASQNHQHIWHTLKKIPKQHLQEQLYQSDESLRPWIELAHILNNSQADIQQQLAQLDSWKKRWPEFKSSAHVRQPIEAFKTLSHQQPRSIALFVPLSGKLKQAGQAVLDGMLAAYFEAKKNHWSTIPSITTYDTQQFTIAQAYKQALNDGADMIIGPLQKHAVSELISLNPSIPVLSLNYITNDPQPTPIAPIEPVELSTPSDLGIDDISALSTLDPNDDNTAKPAVIQFGLAVEDEAIQLAEFASLNGGGNALVLQSNALWASRASSAFIDEWLSLNGQIIAHKTLHNADDFANDIANAMLLPESQNRLKRLQQLTTSNLEFTPRRRQDIDLIVLFTNSAQAKSIKPLLSYYYASKIPVYSSSHVFDGQTKNSDLEGIIFNDMPWVLHEHALRDSAPGVYQTNIHLKRLFAMGVDAFYAHPRLAQLASSSPSKINGYTGQLSLQDGRILRKTVMAQFKQGKAVPLSSKALATP